MGQQRTTRPDDNRLLIAFFLSGFAALGYEVLWTRIFALALGSEILAVLGTLAGFFGGMVLGASWFYGRTRKLKNPVKAFAILEVVAGLFALSSPWWLLPLASTMPAWLGPAAGENSGPIALLLAVLIPGLILLPATFCMGATLPVLVEAWERLQPKGSGRGTGRLYGANTFGAMSGLFLSIYLIIPQTGFGIGAACLALIGLGSSAIAWHWGKAQAWSQVESASEAPATKDNPGTHKRLYILLFLTGLAGIGLEISVVNVVGQILENTIFTFANLLSVYLLGTAAGAWYYQSRIPGSVKRKGKQRGDDWHVRSGKLLSWLLAASAYTALVSIASGTLLGHLLPDKAGAGMHMIAEILLAMILFLPPTFIMGMLFSHLIGRVESEGIGRAYAWNMLGATLAPFLFGLVGIELLGLSWSLRLALVIYAGALTWWQGLLKISGPQKFAFPALALAVMALLPSQFRVFEIPQGFELKSQRESLQGTILITTSAHEFDAFGNRLVELQVGKHFRMGGGRSYAEQRMGHMPMLLVPNAESVLFLGVGTGATAGAALHYPQLNQLEAVELARDVVDQLSEFQGINNGLHANPKAKVHAMDARRFAAASNKSYDLVVADLFHPGRDGAGNLFTLEHFRKMRALSPDGLAAQWLPLHELDVPSLKLVLRTWLDVFPQAHAFLGYYNNATPLLLLTGSEELKIDLEYIERMTTGRSAGAQVIESSRDFLTSYWCDSEALRKYAGNGPLNRDIHPVLTFSAPRAAYANRREEGAFTLKDLESIRMEPQTSLYLNSDSTSIALHNSGMKSWDALGDYLKADRMRLHAEVNRQPLGAEAIRLYLQCYDKDRRFSPARGMLISQASHNPGMRKMILNRLEPIDRRKVR